MTKLQKVLMVVGIVIVLLVMVAFIWLNSELDTIERMKYTIAILGHYKC